MNLNANSATKFSPIGIQLYNNINNQNVRIMHPDLCKELRLGREYVNASCLIERAGDDQTTIGRQTSCMIIRLNSNKANLNEKTTLFVTEITLDVIPHVRCALLEPQVPVASAQSQPAIHMH